QVEREVDVALGRGRRRRAVERARAVELERVDRNRAALERERHGELGRIVEHRHLERMSGRRRVDRKLLSLDEQQPIASVDARERRERGLVARYGVESDTNAIADRKSVVEGKS